MRIVRKIYTLLLTFLAPSLALAQSPSYSCQILHQSADSLVVQLEVGAYSADTFYSLNKEWLQLRLPGAPSTHELGHPRLPFVTIPLQGIAENGSVRVFSANYRTVSSVAPIPSRGLFVAGSPEAKAPLQPSAIYNATLPYPASEAELGGKVHAFGQQGVVLRIYPFRYYPHLQQIQLATSMRVVIYPKAPRPVAPRSVAASPYFLNAPKTRSLSQNRGRLLIVYHRQFEHLLDSLVHWKRMSGLEVECAAYDTQDADALQSREEIQAFVKANYERDQQLRYLLLIGSFANLPAFKEQGITSTMDSDIPYACVTAEPPNADFSVGRLYAERDEELKRQIEKIIAYERDLTPASMWLANALGIASGEKDTGYNNKTDAEQITYLGEELTSCGFTVTNLYGNAQETAVTPEQVADAINQGVGIINYLGHGYSDRWGTSNMKVQDALALQNRGMWPFVVSAACDNGKHVTSISFAEAWMVAQYEQEPTGAIAFTGATNEIEWVAPMLAQELTNFRFLFKGYPYLPAHTLGDAFYYAKAKMREGYPSVLTDRSDLAWHLFGDPSTIARSSIPQMISVDLPTEISQYATELSIPAPIADGYGTICLHRANEPLRYRTARVAEKALKFDNLALLAGDTIELAIVASNRVTVCAKIPVNAPEKPYALSFTGVMQQKKHSAIAHELTPDAVWEVEIHYSNVGQLDFSDSLALQIAAEPEGILDLSKLPKKLPPLEAGMTSEQPLKLLMPVSDTITQPCTVTLSVAALKEEEPLAQLALQTEVLIPTLTIDSIRVQPNADQKAILIPGEPVTLAIYMRNENLTTLAVSSVTLRYNEDLWHSIPSFEIAPTTSKTELITFTLPEDLPTEAFWATELFVQAEKSPLKTIAVPLVPYYDYEMLGDLALGAGGGKGRTLYQYLIKSEEIADAPTRINGLELTFYNPTTEPIQLPGISAVLERANVSAVENLQVVEFPADETLKRLTILPGLSTVTIPLPPFDCAPGAFLNLKLAFDASSDGVNFLTVMTNTREIVGAVQQMEWQETKLSFTKRLPKMLFSLVKEVNIALQAIHPNATLKLPFECLHNGKSYPINEQQFTLLTFFEGDNSFQVRSDYYRDSVYAFCADTALSIYRYALQLAPPVSVTLIFTDEKDEILPNLAFEVDGTSYATNADGVATISLGPGKYQLYVAGQSTRPIGYKLDVKKLSDTLLVAVPTNRDIALVTASQKGAFSCYPNPTMDGMVVLFSELGINSVTIHTLQGQRVYRKNTDGEINLQLNLAHLPSGCYIVEIVNAAGDRQQLKLLLRE